MTPLPTPPERFLNVFQGDVRNNVVAFSRRLWEHDSDVFLFMARKAACFFVCLRELKLADVRGLALSDRILDSDLSFLKGKRVTLVDDCIFTGTTLCRARDAVVQAGCSHFDTMALAVNIDSLRPSLLPGGAEWEQLRIEQPVHQLSDSDCVRQCYDIVRAVSIIPRPYDVDFPHSRTFKLKDEAFDALLRLPGWTAFDATCDFQRGHQVRTFTLLPMRHISDAFCEMHGRTGPSLPSVKIRVYAKQSASTSWSVRLVPMVMYPAIHDAATTKALCDAAAGERDVVPYIGLATPQARYRMLHFVTAHAFLDYFIETAATPAGIGATADIRHDLMEMSFGSGAFQKYQECWPKRATIAMPESHGSTMAQAVDYDGMPRSIDEAAAIADEAIDPFLWLYKNRELPTRAFVKAKGLDNTTVEEFSHIKRLVQGFTPTFLFRRIQNPELDMPVYVSCLLDRFVDIGIAVPTIAQDGDVCCRAFRHGEDAVIGEAQERLVLEALAAYLKARGLVNVWGLELQKFLVLVIQIGIRNGLLDRLNMLPTVPVGARVVSIKGHLHGPVPVVETVEDPSGKIGPPFIAGVDGHPGWLVDRWVEKGFLERSDGGKGVRYAMAKLPKLSIGGRQEAQARQIGRCLGAACAEADIRIDHDFVMLSTCSEPDHQVRALSGEIAIVRERWVDVSESVKAKLRAQRYGEARQQLRKYKSVFVAINSGVRKYRWYTDGVFTETVNRITRTLQANDNGTTADQWVLLWPSAAAAGKGGAAFIDQNIDASGRWLMSVNVAIRLIDYWIVWQGKQRDAFTAGDLADAVRDVKECAVVLQATFAGSKQPAFVEMMKEVVSRIALNDEEDARSWCEEAGRLLSVFVQRNAKLLLDEAAVICGAYGALDLAQTFPYAVWIDVDARNPKAQQALARAQERGMKACKGEIYQPLRDSQNPWRSGRWVVMGGNRNSTAASTYCNEVAVHLAKEGVAWRGVVVGQLSADDCIRTFTHSTTQADGYFYRRLAELRQHIVSEEYDCTVTCVNEHDENYEDEGVKLARVAGVEVGRARRVSTGGDENDISGKEFTVSAISLGRYGSVADGSADIPGGRSNMPSKQTPAVVLLCTATDKEDDGIAEYLHRRGLGTGESKVLPKGIYKQWSGPSGERVYWVRSGMGSQGSDGASVTLIDAIDDVDPDYVISCGLAFGHNSEKQKIGDVLVSEWVRSYDPGRQEPGKFIARGPRVPADPHLLQIARIVRREVAPVRVTVGGFLSGAKLVDDLAFKQELWKIEPEAVGGDMEGAGIVDACQRRQRRWIVIKAICDWGESKDSAAQPAAVANAVRVVAAIIDSGGLIQRS